jgi:hypothetical protein
VWQLLMILVTNNRRLDKQSTKKGDEGWVREKGEAQDLVQCHKCRLEPSLQLINMICMRRVYQRLSNRQELNVCHSIS